MLRVTPVYGSRFDDEGAAQAPSCTLIEYGGVKVLWNVGWWGEAEATTVGDITTSNTDPNSTTSNNVSNTTNNFPELPDHDVLIVSDSTLNSLGGLPLYYQTHWKQQLRDHQKQIPMLATFPTVKMGQMTLYDHHAAVSLDGGRPPFTMEQMDDAFSQLQTIKYSQTIPVRAFSTIRNSDNSSTTTTTTVALASKPALSITAHRAGHVVGGAFFCVETTPR